MLRPYEGLDSFDVSMHGTPATIPRDNSSPEEVHATLHLFVATLHRFIATLKVFIATLHRCVATLQSFDATLHRILATK